MVMEKIQVKVQKRSNDAYDITTMDIPSRFAIHKEWFGLTASFNGRKFEYRPSWIFAINGNTLTLQIGAIGNNVTIHKHQLVNRFNFLNEWKESGTK